MKKIQKKLKTLFKPIILRIDFNDIIESMLLLFNLISYNLNKYNIIKLIFIMLIFWWGTQKIFSKIVFIYLIRINVNSEYLGQAICLYSLLSGLSILIAASFARCLAKISFGYIFIYSSIVTVITLIIILLVFNSASIKFRVN